MIPWHLSTWSTRDALRAVGLGVTINDKARMPERCEIRRGSKLVEAFGNVFDANEWLVGEGYVQRWAVIGGEA